jgi:hypothetical protein
MERKNATEKWMVQVQSFPMPDENGLGCKTAPNKVQSRQII